MAFFHAVVRLGGFGERVGCVDDDAEDDVDALSLGRRSDRLDEVFGFVVDRVRRSELAASLALLRRACGCDDLRAERVRELDGGHADAAGAAMHEEPLSTLQAAAL